MHVDLQSLARPTPTPTGSVVCNVCGNAYPQFLGDGVGGQGWLTNCIQKLISSHPNSQESHGEHAERKYQRHGLLQMLHCNCALHGLSLKRPVRIQGASQGAWTFTKEVHLLQVRLRKGWAAQPEAGCPSCLLLGCPARGGLHCNSDFERVGCPA